MNCSVSCACSVLVLQSPGAKRLQGKHHVVLTLRLPVCGTGGTFASILFSSALLILPLLLNLCEDSGRRDRTRDAAAQEA